MRARDTLAEVELIAAEDTRHTGQLLAQLGIATPLQALHEHNEVAETPRLVARLAAGARIALVSDAGTPLISDPGFRLVAAAAAAGIRVVPVPGASAAVAALSVAGLPTDRFVFEGFLPARATARRARLATLAFESRTLVFYEAPHRIEQTVADLVAAFGAERPAVLARELTKLHETVYRGSLAELATRIAAEPNMARGEAVLVIGGAPETSARVDAALLDRLLAGLLAGMPLAAAVDLAAELTGERRNRIYERALAVRHRGADSPDRA